MEKAAKIGEQRKPLIIASNNEEKVFACLLSDKYHFRTVKGISGETGIGESEVENILKDSKYVRKSLVTDKKGNNLFTHRKRSMRFKEFLALVQSILAKSCNC